MKPGSNRLLIDWSLNQQREFMAALIGGQQSAEPHSSQAQPVAITTRLGLASWLSSKQQQ
jgi:hypothetical protein